MPETVERCPLCGSEHSSLFDHRLFRRQPVSNLLCAGCGLVYQSPRMTADELETFYAREYRQVYQGVEGPTAKDLAVQGGRADALLAFLAEHRVAAARYLDIGASAGVMLQRFAVQFGCQAVGVEPGKAYRRYAQARELTLYADLDALRAAGEPPFDLVSMAHVLEHLPDPVGYLKSLRAYPLSPEGWLLLEVPNLYCHDSFEVAHLTSFSAHTLRETLAQAGYQVVALKAHGRPRSALLPLYLTALARPAESADARRVRPERGVALKRRAGMFRRRVIQRLLPHRAWSPPEGELS